MCHCCSCCHILIYNFYNLPRICAEGISSNLPGMNNASLIHPWLTRKDTQEARHKNCLWEAIEEAQSDMHAHRRSWSCCFIFKKYIKNLSNLAENFKNRQKLTAMGSSNAVERECLGTRQWVRGHQMRYRCVIIDVLFLWWLITLTLKGTLKRNTESV